MSVPGRTVNLRCKGFAAVLILVFFIAGCATTGINKGQFNLVTSDEEVQMGQEVSVEIEKEYPVYKNVCLQPRIQ